MGTPTLLLLPGLLCDARLWRDQIDALSGRARIVVADLTQDDTVEAMARRALDAVGDGPFAMAGLSMGGYVAFAVLRAAAARVARLALLDTSARRDTEEQSRRRRGLIALTRQGRFRGVTPRLLPMLVHPDRLNDAALTDEVMQMAERIGKDAFLRQQAAILGRPDSRADLPGWTMPARIVVGEGDQLTPPDHAREMAELLPHASLTILPGCGHLPPMEDPEAVNAILSEWLEEAPVTA
jgi:pimeloyl-ACP methyl ester carboxylesterase